MRDHAVVGLSRPVATGFSSTIYRTAEGHCLKVPRDAEAAGRLRRAESALARLAEHLTVELPVTLGWLPAEGEWPHGAQLSRWLEGEHLTAEADPRSVGRLLTELRAVPPGRLAGMVDDYQRWWPERVAEAEAGLSALAGRLDPALMRRLHTAVEAQTAELAGLTTPGVVHGDLWQENLLTRAGRVTGVLDWENLAIGDPAVDLAPLWYLGGDWARRVLDVVRPGSGELRRVAGWRILRELDGAAWAQRESDLEELAESAEKVTSIAKALGYLT